MKEIRSKCNFGDPTMRLWQVVGIYFLDNYGAMIHFVVLWVFGWLLIWGYGNDLWNDLLMIERGNLWLAWYGV
jgi:hypothetical protein